jgi:flavin reductase (DIM6/NTAB) family NADH-FMN oxidoreductase RutF
MRKIWNRPNQVVWSLATADKECVGNMNICTYVSSVSMEPKLMMVAVYHGTKTHSNVTATKKEVLQLLTEELAPVTRVCGHLSGNNISKISRLKKRYDISSIGEVPYFTASAGYVELRLEKLIAIGGDHDIGIFSVVGHKNLHDAPLLTTEYLRSSGLLR